MNTKKNISGSKNGSVKLVDWQSKCSIKDLYILEDFTSHFDSIVERVFIAIRDTLKGKEKPKNGYLSKEEAMYNYDLQIEDSELKETIKRFIDIIRKIYRHPYDDSCINEYYNELIKLYWKLHPDKYEIMRKTRDYLIIDLKLNCIWGDYPDPTIVLYFKENLMEKMRKQRKEER